MTSHILRLTMGEWYKLRRRWLPWILLGVALLLSQAILWGFHVAYHVSDDAFGSLTPNYEYSNGPVTVELTCADVAEGRVEEKLAPLADEELLMIGEGVARWSARCEDYVSPEESRGVFTLPYSIGANLEVLFGLFFVIIVMILAASVMGVEYGWGTLRTTLSRGSGRWQYLAAKFILILLAGIGGLLVISAAVAVASIIAGLIPPSEEGSLIFSDGWLDSAEALGKALYALAPYVAVGMFLTVLTQSTAQGIALSMVYYVVEALILPPLLGLSDLLENVSEALLSQNVGDWMYQGETAAAQALGAAEQPDTVQAFFVMLAYIVVLAAATFWMFQRRDISGAKGE